MFENPSKHTLSRRRVLALAGGVALAGAGVAPARADAAAVKTAMGRLIGDRTPSEGRIRLEVPQIAENGNTVPLAFSVDSPMTDADHVKAVHVFADGNPSPDVASFHFTPMSGKAEAATRMRLAKTQNVVAVAEMSDGSVYMGQAQVKVTIGGCGG